METPTDVAPSRELLIFDMGVLANGMSWHFDQATFALDRNHRAKFIGLLVPMRRLSGQLLLPAADADFSVFLRQIESWLPTLDTEDFHGRYLQSLETAANRRDGIASEEAFYQDLSPRIMAFREHLEAWLPQIGLADDHDKRWLFYAGVSIDQGRRPPDVARHVFFIEQDTPSTAQSAAVTSLSELAALPSQPTAPSTRSFHPGELPPPDGWRQKVEEVFRQLDLPSPDRYWKDVSDPANLVTTIIEEVRSELMTKTQTTPSDSVRGDAQTLVVTSDQVAVVVGLEPNSMSPYRKAWGDPVSPASGRKPAYYDFERLLPILKGQFPHVKPEKWEVLKTQAVMR